MIFWDDAGPGQVLFSLAPLAATQQRHCWEMKDPAIRMVKIRVNHGIWEVSYFQIIRYLSFPDHFRVLKVWAIQFYTSLRPKSDCWKLIYQTEGSISISHSENPANFHHERPMSRVQWTGEAKTGCSNINEAAFQDDVFFLCQSNPCFPHWRLANMAILEGQNPRYRMV